MIKPQEISKAGSAPKNSFDDPLEHLLACHRRIEQRLESLELVAANYETKPDEARDALQAAFKYFDTNGAWHTEDEERSVFPRIVHMLDSVEFSFVKQLGEQHRDAEDSYGKLKASGVCFDGRFRDVVAEFCAIYREHIATEESQLIAIGRKYLSASQLADISAEMKQRRGLEQK